ncbi:mCG145009, partial [Mus musculus]
QPSSVLLQDQSSLLTSEPACRLLSRHHQEEHLVTTCRDRIVSEGEHVVVFSSDHHSNKSTASFHYQENHLEDFVSRFPGLEDEKYHSKRERKFH